MTGPARVRAAAPADVPALWDLVCALAAYERLEERLVGDPARLAAALFGRAPLVSALVAERDGLLVGYAIFFEQYSTFRACPMLWLEDLFVRPAERAAGTGRALLAAVAAEARSRGCWRLSWEVLEWNRSAIGFYEHLGAACDEGGWRVYHLRGEALDRLAGESPGPR